MNTDLTSIIGPLSGVILGGAITLLVTHIQYKNQEKQRDKERKMKTYEEIHKHLSFLDHEVEYSYIQIVGNIS